jgi:ABC-2 type transport system ATP-binding protein
MLDVKNLRKSYGNKTILDIQELSIPEGIIHLKGINGSGKTTFSKIVAGLIPFDGELLLHGHLNPQNDKVAYRRMVSYAPSEPLYPDFLSPRDLIGFVGKARKASNTGQLQIAERLGVATYLFDPVGTFSSGMLKRLSLCLAFLGEPKLVILDEPFNALDLEAIDILVDLVKEQHKGGVSFMLVSHQDITQVGIRIDETFTVEGQNIRCR